METNQKLTETDKTSTNNGGKGMAAVEIMSAVDSYSKNIHELLPKISPTTNSMITVGSKNKSNVNSPFLPSKAAEEMADQCATNNNELLPKKSPPPPTNFTAARVGLKRKLDVPNSTFLPPEAFKRSRTEDSTQYIHGNYDRYYGYRSYPGKDFKDVRLDAFAQHKQLFEDKSVLDIGCNNGLMTTAVARDFKVKSMIGIDIDRNLIGKAIKWLSVEKKNYPNAHTKETYPHNVLFRCGNYVLADHSLLELETAQFDTILCLSVSKWIHLNGGDAGLKLAFKRMYKQLLPGGCLVLEAQNWKSYKRRKKLTPQIFDNYQKIELQPNMFDDYLLSAEVGFCRWYLIEMSEQQQEKAPKGFQRPIKVRFSVLLGKFIISYVCGCVDSRRCLLFVFRCQAELIFCGSG